MLYKTIHLYINEFFRIDYNKEVDAVPSSKVVVSGIDIDLVFSQTHKSCPFSTS